MPISRVSCGCLGSIQSKDFHLTWGYCWCCCAPDLEAGPLPLPQQTGSEAFEPWEAHKLLPAALTPDDLHQGTVPVKPPFLAGKAGMWQHEPV